MVGTPRKGEFLRALGYFKGYLLRCLESSFLTPNIRTLQMVSCGSHARNCALPSDELGVSGGRERQSVTVFTDPEHCLILDC